MTLLQVILIVASIIFVLFGRDLYKRKRATLLHFLVFVGWSVIIAIFIAYPWFLTSFGKLFGVARGADVLVYASIIFLMYSFISLYNRHLKEDISLSAISSALAISQSTHYGPHKDHTTYILMRCYNEWPAISTALQDLYDHNYKHIVIVDDCSTDNSLSQVTAWHQKHSDCSLTIIKHPLNRGRWGGWATLKTWFTYFLWQDAPSYKHVVTFDPDGQMQAKDIAPLINACDSSTDIVLGSRFINQKDNDIPFWRKIILTLSQWTSRFRDGIALSDPHCGFRVYTPQALSKMDIESDSMDYANEIAQSIKKNNLRYKEIPVTILYTPYSLNKWQSNMNAFNIGRKLVYKKFFFR